MRTQKRRRKQGKTDYKLRLGLLKSGKPRIVIRKTNRYFVAQAVESDEAKDRVIAGVTSKELVKAGWDVKFGGSLKSIPAGYLTGLLLARKIKDKEKEFILDLGIARTIPGSRIYSVTKGLIDGRLNIKIDEKIFPSDERLRGEHLKPEVKEMISRVKSKLGGESKK